MHRIGICLHSRCLERTPLWTIHYLDMQDGPQRRLHLEPHGIGRRVRGCRYPQANRFVVHILAAVAEQEAEAISKRTKAALAAAKARGTKLGGRRVSAERFAEIGVAARQVRTQRVSQVRSELLPTITAIQATGASSLRAIAAELNAREIPTPRRLGEWSAVQVQRVMERRA